MKISYINFLIKNSGYALALFFVFALLTYFARPTTIAKEIFIEKGIVKNITLKRDYTWERSATSKGYTEYFEITLAGNNSMIFRRYSEKEIKNFGTKNIINQKVTIKYFKDNNLKVINDLMIGKKNIIKSKKYGLSPFFLFILLSLLTLIWSIWGIYISEFASEKVQSKYLKK